MTTYRCIQCGDIHDTSDGLCQRLFVANTIVDLKPERDIVLISPQPATDELQQLRSTIAEQAEGIRVLTEDLRKAEARIKEVASENDRLRALTLNPGATLHGSTIQEIADERDSARAECEQMRKYVEHNDEEYRTMKDVLRAEHEACQRMRPVYEAAIKMKETDEAYAELGEGVMATPKAVNDAVVDLYAAIDALSTQARSDGDE